jgi:hypothetical protein
MTELQRTTSNPTLEDVLDEFACAGPNRDQLAEWIAVYPEFERELTELTVSWLEIKHLQPTPSTTDPVDVELKGASILGKVMHVLQSSLASAGSAHDPMKTDSVTSPGAESILERTSRLGIDIRAAAKAIGMSVPMIMSFHQRLIHLTSVPRDALSSLASVLKFSVEELSAYLDQAPLQPPQHQFKAKGAPVFRKVDFTELVRIDTQLSNDNRRKWLELAAGMNHREDRSS